MTDTSKRIFEKLQLRRLKEIFDTIDQDHDGQISENSFEKAQLPQHTMAVLRPLIKQGRTLNFNEFLE